MGFHVCCCHGHNVMTSSVAVYTVLYLSWWSYHRWRLKAEIFGSNTLTPARTLYLFFHSYYLVWEAILYILTVRTTKKPFQRRSWRQFIDICKASSSNSRKTTENWLWTMAMAYLGRQGFLRTYLKEKLISVCFRISRENVSFSSSLRRRIHKANFSYSRKLMRTTLYHLPERMDKTEAGLCITKESVSQVIPEHCVCRLKGVVFIWIKLSLIL